MSTTLLRIATRKSPLALWQAEHVRGRLLKLHPGLEVELVTMSTQGDRVLDSPLAKIGGKGLFVKELEQGMLDGTADIAVHSMKDVPAEFPQGLGLGAILEREDPRDAFVSNAYASSMTCPTLPGWVPPACAASASCVSGALICRFPTCAATSVRVSVNSITGITMPSCWPVPG